MKCMKDERLEAYQVQKNLKKLKELWSEKESVWEMNSSGQIERDQRNERRIAIKKYIDPLIMLDS